MFMQAEHLRSLILRRRCNDLWAYSSLPEDKDNSSSSSSAAAAAAAAPHAAAAAAAAAAGDSCMSPSTGVSSLSSFSSLPCAISSSLSPLAAARTNEDKIKNDKNKNTKNLLKTNPRKTTTPQKTNRMQMNAR